MPTGRSSAQAGAGPAPVLVWGNCQAAPVARLMAGPLAAAGLRVPTLPPVHEVDADGLRDVEAMLPGAAALVTQPIRDEYRISGCGSEQLAARLGPHGRVVTVPVVYDTSAFPYQASVHGADGLAVDAPLTDYHDLRVLVAAERGLDLDATLEWWPTPTATMVRSNAERSRAELARREATLDVGVSDRLDGPVMHTLNHPTNAVLVLLAARVLAVLGLPGQLDRPEREFLGARRAPVEAAVVAALGWPEEAVRPAWQVEGRELSASEVVEAQLCLYAERPDLLADFRQRHRDRLALLGL